MSLLERFLTSFKGTDRGAAEPPGLVQDETGAVWIIAADGSRTQAGGGGGAVLFASVEIGGDMNQYAAATMVPFVPASPEATWSLVTVNAGPVTLPPGGGAYLTMFTPVFTQGVATVGVAEFDVSNASGSEKLSLQHAPHPEEPISSNVAMNFDYSTWNVLEQAGSDLSIGIAHTLSAVVSAAGGQFWLTGIVGVTAAGVAP